MRLAANTNVIALFANQNAYETLLETMNVPELLQEYESAVLDFADKQCVGRDCERVRLCRRVVARRLFARPSAA